ncbi:AAA domain-containing protein [Vibrio vulnificus]|nr:AAA domain-containing protein [Vibrio vulnificus]
MSIENKSRTVICSINSSKFFTENKGKLNVHFEVVGKDIYPINKIDDFCDTSQVFVTSQFSVIENNYRGRLFIAEVQQSVFDVKEGDCHYVLTSIENCSELRNIGIAEIVECPLPSPEIPVINQQYLPLSRMIFVKEGQYIYGPFEYKAKEIEGISSSYELTLSTPSTPLFTSKRSIPKSHVISKVEVDLLKDDISEYRDKYNPDKYITLIPINKDLASKRDEELDFITDEQIIKTIGELVQTRPGKRWATNAELQNLQKESKANKQYNNLGSRFDRFFDIISNLDEWSLTRNKLISDYFSTDEGKLSVENYINSNKELYFSDLKDEYLLKIQDECKEKQRELDAFSEQLIDIQEEIRDAKEELSRLEKNRDTNTESEEIKNKIALETKKVQDELSEKNRQLDDIKTQLSQYNSFDELKKQRETIENEYNLFRKLKDDLQQEVEGHTDKLLANMIKLKPQVDALLGTQSKNKKTSYNFNLSCSDEEVTASDYVRQVDEAIRSHGRETDFNQVANLLITIAQSQFTLFSGQPGTGKTSMAQLVGKAMGLNNRLLTIPVAKGWTSTRDILGFYNTLSQTYQPASSGLYELLEHLDKEKNASSAFVLLDEFNLSQPEHYLSNFLEMADEGSMRRINTGEPSKVLSVPQYLRFIGTLNSDETVQSLSPRMLDRAAVITFDQMPTLEQIIDTKSNIEPKSTVPIYGSKFIEMFTSSNSMNMPANYKQILHVCTSALETPKHGLPVNISMRKMKAITQYCDVAYNIINSATGSLAIDYALSQHVLPVLNGHGANFGNRLEHLLESLNNLPDDLSVTTDKLERMIEVGRNNFDTYSLLA